MIKFNIPYLKKWANTVFNPGKSDNYFDNTKPINWGIDDFASWFLRYGVNYSNEANTFTKKVFGIPVGTKLTFLFAENDGSGLNGNKYWKRFGSTKSALYDVWEHLKPKLASQTSEGKNMKPRNIGLMQIVENIVLREIAAKRKRRKLTEASLEKDPVKAYIQTALWSSSDDEDNSLDSQYGYEDVAQESITKAKSDLKSLIQQLKQAKLYDVYMQEYDLSQLAHDFWLTRNGHGAGFWDRDYSTDDLGDKITDIVKKFRPVDAVVGDDGKIYFE